MSTKKTRKQYTPEFKAAAAKLVLEQGLIEPSGGFRFKAKRETISLKGGRNEDVGVVDGLEGESGRSL